MMNLIHVTTKRKKNEEGKSSYSGPIKRSTHCGEVLKRLYTFVFFCIVFGEEKFLGKMNHGPLQSYDQEQFRYNGHRSF